MKKAAVNPSRLPTHQPTAPPTVAPTKAKSLDTGFHVPGTGGPEYSVNTPDDREKPPRRRGRSCASVSRGSARCSGSRSYDALVVLPSIIVRQAPSSPSISHLNVY